MSKTKLVYEGLVDILKGTLEVEELGIVLGNVNAYNLLSECETVFEEISYQIYEELIESPTRELSYCKKDINKIYTESVHYPLWTLRLELSEYLSDYIKTIITTREIKVKHKKTLKG